MDWSRGAWAFVTGAQLQHHAEPRLVERLGSLSLVHVDLDHGASLIAQVGGAEEIRPYQRIQLAIDPTYCHVFDETGRALEHKDRPTHRRFITA